MMLAVRIAERAESDLAHQYGWYVKNATVEVAERFLLSFHETLSVLADQPQAGYRRYFKAPELAGIRSYPVQRPFGVHLIFYQASDDLLVIERVIHGSRDLLNCLLD